MPLTPATRNLIDAARLATMKPMRSSSTRRAAASSTKLPSRRRCVRASSAARRSTCSTTSRWRRIAARGLPATSLLTPHIAGVTRESNRRVSALIAAKVAPLLAAAPLSSRMPTFDARRAARSRAHARWSAPARPARWRACTAAALVDAEAQGLSSHGVARVAQYATHLRNGRADGDASPSIVRERGGAVLVDARCGLAFPACALAVDEAIRRAREFGVAFAGVTNSHHFGVAAWHLRAGRGDAGMVGLAFGNSPGGDAGGRRQARAVRHESDRRGVSRDATDRRCRSTCRCRKSRAAR